MANRKILGQAAPAAATETDLYAVPAGLDAVASSCVVANRGSTSATFRISASVAGAATATKDYIAYDVTIQANESIEFTIGMTLAATDKVRVLASTANLSFTLFGQEQSSGGAGNYVIVAALADITSTYAGLMAFVTTGADAGKVFIRNDGNTAWVEWIETGAWASYTPVLTASGTNPTLGTGAVQDGFYIRMGRLVYGWAWIKFGTSGAAAGSGSYFVSLPINADLPPTAGTASYGNGVAVDSTDASSNGLRLLQVSSNDATTCQLAVEGARGVTDAVPWVWAASDHLRINFTYEAAA